MKFPLKLHEIREHCTSYCFSELMCFLTSAWTGYFQEELKCVCDSAFYIHHVLQMSPVLKVIRTAAARDCRCEQNLQIKLGGKSDQVKPY